MNNRKFLISVIGGHKCSDEVAGIAEKIGEAIAESGAVLVTGGLEGVMLHASKGAKKKNGLTVGIIPGENKKDANKYVDIIITTGMGYSRNTLVAQTSDLIVALSGEYGTLSEIAFALNAKKQVYSYGSWDIKGAHRIDSIDELKKAISLHMNR